MSTAPSLKQPGLHILHLNREIEAANRRVRDLEHHLRAALNHIALEHRPPVDLLAAAHNLLENTK